MALRIQGNISFTCITVDITKDSDDGQMEELCRAKHVSTLLHVVSNLEASGTWSFWLSMEASLCRHNGNQLDLQSFSPLEAGGVGEIPNLLIVS